MKISELKLEDMRVIQQNGYTKYRNGDIRFGQGGDSITFEMTSYKDEQINFSATIYCDFPDVEICSGKAETLEKAFEQMKEETIKELTKII